jgi:putative PEP-CTERM system TPR-repeat lipoprotein
LALSLAALLMLGGCDLFMSPTARVDRADRAIAEHRYREALIDLKNAIEAEPDHQRGRLRLAIVEFQLGDLAAAERDLKRAIELGAAPKDTAELNAKLRLASGHPQELLAELDAGKSGLDGSGAALYRGLARLALRDYTGAIEALEAVPQGDARWVAARASSADALARLGQPDEAIAGLDAVLAASPAGYQAWVTRGSLRARVGDFAAAESDLHEARKHQPADLPAADQAQLLSSLGEVQLAQGKVDAAAATQATMTGVAPNAIANQVLAARIALARQDYSTAAGLLQRVVQAAPELAAVRLLLAAALSGQGNLGQAEQQLAQVVQLAPANVEARKMLAQVQMRTGRADAAVQILESMEGAGDPQVDRLLGFANLQRGQQASGLAFLEKAAAANPVDAKLKLDLAVAYLTAAQPRKAVELLQSMKQPADEVRHVGLLVAALVASGDAPGARKQVDALIAARPKDAVALLLGVEYSLQQRDFAQARVFAQRAIDLDPRNPQLQLSRARIEALAGKTAEAGQWIDRALEIDPGNAAAHFAQAELAMRRGEIDAAARALEDLRRRDRDAADVRLRLMAIYLQQKNNKAEQLIDEITELGRNRPELLNSLGLLLLDNARYDVALSKFRDAALRDSTNPAYWFNAARAQIAMGDSGVARDSLHKAVEARPGWMPAVSTLALLDAREGRGSEALQRVSELRNSRPPDAGTRVLEGDVHMEMHEYAKAVASYQEAAAIAPSGAIAFKVYQARKEGGLPGATDPLEAWLAGHPADDPVRLALAEEYQARGELRRSAQHYEAIRAAGRASRLVLNNLAWTYYRMRDARAEAIARQAYDSGPKVAAISDTYGWILLENGHAAEALPILQTAAADDADAAMQYHYAVALVRTGAREEGLRLLQEALAREPGFEGAEDARKQLEANAVP